MRARSAPEYDVLVVGGGPSGAATGFWLAERGHRVLIVEKKRFPREKTCGDGLTPRAVRQLNDMGLADRVSDFQRYDGLRSIGHGVTLDGQPVQASSRPGLAGATVLASRSEVRRKEWEGYREDLFTIRPCGSVAFKLAQVAAGLADATWTLVPKHEWDVAAGVALILAAGGTVWEHEPGQAVPFNRPKPKLTRLLAAPPQLVGEIEAEIARRG